MNAATVDELREQLAAMAPAWHPKAFHNFEVLVGGYSNHSYRLNCTEGEALGDCVLRVPRKPLDHQARKDLQWELEYLKALVATTLDIPSVLGFNQESGALLTRWQAGQHLHECPPDQQPLHLQTLTNHLTHLPAQSRPYDPLSDFAHLDSMPQWLRMRLDQSATWLAGQSHQRQPSHNDLNPYNLLCQPNASSPLVLDWEQAGLNVQGFDLVTAHLGLARETSSLQSVTTALLRQFGSKSGLQLLQCYWLRELGWALRQRQRGNELPAVNEQRQLAERQLGLISVPA